MAIENERVPLSAGVSEPSAGLGAVFLSYASEDAASAERIAMALRNAGIDVWFDKSELRGGDAWDRKIRKQIHDCVLFIPVISAHSQARLEGYFRREWKLAADRTHDMDERKAFLVPVVIDTTPERGAAVPEKFHELQWTRLPGGDTPPSFVERIRRLLTPDVASASTGTPASGVSSAPFARRPSLPKAAIWGASTIAAIACTYLVANKFWLSKRSVPPAPAVALTAPQATPSAGVVTAFNPPPHSIAVLPFVNMSGDKDQEYFSDGLSEELLNDLARINQLQVAARTSAFSFKGKDTDIETIARKLNVGAVLEGSVRRSAHRMRVTTQLINAVTGFHVWSETYDRDLGDVLKLQTEIAESVVGALKVTLLGDVASRVEAGGTRNPAAFDAYLRATKAYFDAQDAKGEEAAIATYTEALRLDPEYALALAGRSIAFLRYANDWATGSAIRESLDKAEADARKAIVLAPDLGEGHMALAKHLAWSLEFPLAMEEYEHALALAPGNARVLREYGRFAIWMGHTEQGLAAVRRAVASDPLNSHSRMFLVENSIDARRFDDAIAALTEAESIDPNLPIGDIKYWLAMGYYWKGDFDKAREACDGAFEFDKVDYISNLFCRAIIYQKLGRHADAEVVFGRLQRPWPGGNSVAIFNAAIYSQWGDRRRALDWLETALREHDPDLNQLRTPWFDPLRNEPRFQAIERALKFPD